MAILLLLPLVLAAGCSRPVDTVQQPAVTFREDLPVWRLPLDDVVAAPERADFAQSVLVARCMRGYGITVPVVNDADYLGASTNPNLRRLFDVSLASRYGYHAAPSRKPPGTAPRPHLSSKGARREEDCTRRAVTQLGRFGPTESLINHLAGQAYSAAKASPVVEEDAKAWRACVSGQLQIPDLPDDPVAMPAPSQKKRFGWKAGADQKIPPLTPLEVTEASVDARCRDSSHYSADFYHQEVTAQLVAIQANPQAVADAARARSATLTAEQRVLGDR